MSAMGATGAGADQIESRDVRNGFMPQLRTLNLPRALHDFRQAMDYDVQEASHQQAENTPRKQDGAGVDVKETWQIRHEYAPKLNDGQPPSIVNHENPTRRKAVPACALAGAMCACRPFDRISRQIQTT